MKVCSNEKCIKSFICLYFYNFIGLKNIKLKNKEKEEPVKQEKDKSCFKMVEFYGN